MHEILSSNLWSLALVFALGRGGRCAKCAACWLLVMPVLAMLAVWLLMADARPGHLPPTYATPLLYLHTLVGKLFLGLLLVAVALGAVPALRRTAWGAARCAGLPDDRRFDELAHRFAAYALRVRHADADRRRGVGAGRLGPLLGLGSAGDLGLRSAGWRWPPRCTRAPRCGRRRRVFGAWLAGVFVLAFLTFFGVPFISTAPHKGAV